MDALDALSTPPPPTFTPLEKGKQPENAPASPSSPHLDSMSTPPPPPSIPLDKGKQPQTSTSIASSPSDSVTLISKEGDSFQVTQAAAFTSPALKSMLESGFEESETKTITLQVTTPVLEKVVEYLQWFHKYNNAPTDTRVPDFEKNIPPELAMELLMTADFLDL